MSTYTLHIQIKDFVRQMLVDLLQGKLPSVSLAKYQLCNVFSKESSSDVKSSWDYPALFHDVKTIDQAINDICIHFNCNRGSLNVVSVSKGLVMGWLSYNDDSRKIDCMKYSCTGLSIPVHTNLVQNIASFADYILLVEKETGWCLMTRRLCAQVSENLSMRIKPVQIKSFRGVFVQEKGYPDVATRSFLRLLKDKLHLPVFGLVDGDPYGLDILLTYTFGSLTMAYDTEALVTPSIHWLGVLLSDCEAFGVPTRCLLPLTGANVG
ncbi:hypothetical protein L7F22_062664 [Adiantum nelumboides]|nr:hypothetical protein [Adiantum nelumboides]